MTTSPEELPERRQFDFWLGTWDARWRGGRGTNTITAELGGTVIMERFDGRPGTPLQGISVSVYDAAESIWRQAWVDSTGGYLDFTGGPIEGGMELRRAGRVDAPPYRMRFVDIRPLVHLALGELERGRVALGRAVAHRLHAAIVSA